MLKRIGHIEYEMVSDRSVWARASISAMEVASLQKKRGIEGFLVKHVGDFVPDVGLQGPNLDS